MCSTRFWWPFGRPMDSVHAVTSRARQVELWKHPRKHGYKLMNGWINRQPTWLHTTITLLMSVEHWLFPRVIGKRVGVGGHCWLALGLCADVASMSFVVYLCNASARTQSRTPLMSATPAVGKWESNEVLLVGYILIIHLSWVLYCGVTAPKRAVDYNWIYIISD